MYKLEINTGFSAAHRLINYPGMCERIHGHNWEVKVTVIAEKLDESGMAVDLVTLKRQIDEIVAPLEHRLINEVPPFDNLNPTSENMAKYIYGAASEKLDLRVESVRVAETGEYGVVYQP